MDLTVLQIAIPSAVGTVSGALAFYFGRKSVKQPQPKVHQSLDHSKCSKCNSIVARYFFEAGNIVCANCDPLGFENRNS